MSAIAVPDRRLCKRYRFEHRSHRYYGTIGIDPATLQPVEIFLQTGRAGSEMEAVARDAAVLASKALQHGATIPELRSAMTEIEIATEAGVKSAPAGPVAVLFDLFTTDMARAG